MGIGSSASVPSPFILSKNSGAANIGLSTGEKVEDYVGAQRLSTKATLAGLSFANAASIERAYTLGRDSKNDLGGGMFVWQSGNQSANVTADPEEGMWVPPTADASGASGAWERIPNSPFKLPEFWGGYGDGTNRHTAIQAAADWVGSNYGQLLFSETSSSYDLGSNSLSIKNTGITLAGVNCRACKITSSNASVIDNDGTTARFYVTIDNLYLESSASANAKVFDFTYFKNSRFSNNIFSVNGGSNPSLVYGEGTSGGASPYYNTFTNNDLGVSGGPTGTILGYNFKATDIGGGTIRGPNSNTVIGGRVAACTESIRIQAGNNNTFQGVASEAVLSGGYDVTLGASTANITGTATSGGGSSLVDTGASFTSTSNGMISITGGTGAGQTRKIESGSGTTITTKTPWTTVPDNTSVYAVWYPACTNNTFINLRAEGSTSKSGFVRRRGGEYQNEIFGAHPSSMGSGILIDEDIFDFSNINQFSGMKDPIAYTFFQDNVAASQSGVQINAVGNGTEYVMPHDGDIVAISVISTTTNTTGSLSVKPSVNGIAKTLTAALDTTYNQTQNTQIGAWNDDSIGGRNRRLGVEVTTDGSWAHVTATITVTVWVVPRN